MNKNENVPDETIEKTFPNKHGIDKSKIIIKNGLIF